MNALHTDSYTPTANGEHDLSSGQPVTCTRPRSLLEPVARKRARPVLRGPRRSNAPGLPDEIFFGIITRQAIRRGTFTSVKDLIAAIETFIDAWNERCEPFVWTKTADQIIPRVTKSQATSIARH